MANSLDRALIIRGHRKLSWHTETLVAAGAEGNTAKGMKWNAEMEIAFYVIRRNPSMMMVFQPMVRVQCMCVKRLMNATAWH